MTGSTNTTAARFSVIILSASMVSTVYAQDIPAFPGAEGYGAVTTGGRGGKVIAVTNLKTSGPGSLQAACDAEGPRIVVFKVAGTIDGEFRIRDDHITIAGQTAPGDGITIKGDLGIDASDVVIRYIRVRTDGDGYTNVEEYLNGTDPTEFVDYTKPENNTNTLEKSHEN